MEIYGTIREVFDKFKKACNDGKFDLEKKYELYINESDKTPEEIRRKAQNDKYWVLLNQFVKWHKKCGYTQQHNQLLAEYAPILTEKGEDGKQHKKWVLKPKGFRWDKQMVTHYKPTGKFTKDEKGNEYEAFYEIKGSKTMTVKEFDILLEGLINEIQGSDASIDVN